MRLIVGLGNPGKKYERTRHNVGFLALDLLADKYHLTWREDKKWHALVADWQGDLLVKPLTFMNLSGEAVQKIMAFYNLLERDGKNLKAEANLADNLVVIHDEVDLPLGTVRKSVGSSSAGHNGIKSLINHLHTKNFTRYRIGIKTDNLGKTHLGFFKTTTPKFVLSNFTKDEIKILNQELEKLITSL